MLKAQTHFEQVPLKAVMKIVEAEALAKIAPLATKETRRKNGTTARKVRV
jgi:hypothetical protein